MVCSTVWLTLFTRQHRWLLEWVKVTGILRCQKDETQLCTILVDSPKALINFYSLIRLFRFAFMVGIKLCINFRLEHTDTLSLSAVTELTPDLC